MRFLAVIICSLLSTLAAHAQDAAPLYAVLAGAWTPLDLSPVAWWRGESNALDSAGVKNGTWVAPEAYSVGRVGFAFYNPSDDHTSGFVSTPQNLYAYGIRRHATISAWVKPTMPGTLNQRHIFGDWNLSLGLSAYIPMGTRQLGAYVYPGNYRAVSANNVITYGDWNHVTVVLSGTAITLYHNGLQVATSALGGDLGDSAVPFRIGYRGDQIGTIKGSVDEVIIWDRALSSNEIMQVYNWGH